MSTTDAVLAEIRAERGRQDDKWGEQNWPDGTGGPIWEAEAMAAKAATDANAQNGSTTYGDILIEEVYEAMAESDAARLREELIQVAAVAAAWVESIDRRNA